LDSAEALPEDEEALAAEARVAAALQAAGKKERKYE
jgi:hypothetical protein